MNLLVPDNPLYHPDDILLRHKPPVSGVGGVDHVVSSHEVVVMLESVARQRLAVRIRLALLPVPRDGLAQLPLKQNLIDGRLLGRDADDIAPAWYVYRAEVLQVPSRVLVWRQPKSPDEAVWHLLQTLLLILQSQCAAEIVVAVVPVHCAHAVAWQSDGPLAEDIVDDEAELPPVVGEVEHHNVIVPYPPEAFKPERLELLPREVEVKIRVYPSPERELVGYDLIPRLQRGAHGLSGDGEVVHQEHTSQQPHPVEQGWGCG